MKWLLLVLVFEMSPEGQMTPRATMTRAYANEAECNVAGRNFRDIFELPDRAKSFSICIPADKFTKRDWDVTEY